MKVFIQVLDRKSIAAGFQSQWNIVIEELSQGICIPVKNPVYRQLEKTSLSLK